MDARMVCFECGKGLPAVPEYIRLGGIRMRCAECAERHQAARPVVPLDLTTPQKKQITLNRSRPRRKGISDEVLDAVIGTPRAA